MSLRGWGSPSPDDGSGFGQRDRDVAENPLAYLSQCFFVIDTRPGEEDPAEDQVPFFHPASVPLETQIWCVGVLMATQNLVTEFSDEPLQVVGFEKWKAAVLEVPPLILVLTGAPEETDAAIQDALHHLYKALVFFNGPVVQFLAKHEKEAPDREAFRRTLQHRVFGPLVPLALQYLSTQVKAFYPVPFTQLPMYAKRLHIAASQLLLGLHSDSDTYGGCVLYDRTVLCTHLDLETTRWVLARQLHVAIEPTTLGDPFVYAEDNAVTEEFLAVFVSHPVLDSLAKQHGRNLEPSPEIDPALELPDDMTARLDQGRFVGLYTRTINRVSLSVLVSLPALHSTRFISKLRLGTHSKLCQLESQLQRAFQDSPPTTELVNNMAVKRPSAATAAAAANSNHVVFDRMSQTAVGSFVDVAVESDRAFLSGVSAANELFREDPDASLVILRDCYGYLYARHVFGNQVFYQQKSGGGGSGSSSDARRGYRDDPANLEKTAAEALRAAGVRFL